MVQTTLKTRILLCSNDTASWESSDKVLLKGEVGIEFTEDETPKIKIGDGSTAFSKLPYAVMTPKEVRYLINSINIEINNKADLEHTHSKSDITDFPTSMTPTSHASSGTTYGKGSGSNYGHVKLSDSTSSGSSVSDGIAATPRAVTETYNWATDAYNLADSKADASHSHSIDDITSLKRWLPTG